MSVAVFAGLAGCTVQETFDSDGLVSRSVGMGFISASDCRQTGQHSERTSLGFILSNKSAGLGLEREARTCLPTDACSAVFFVETQEMAMTLHRLFPDLDSACVISNTTSVTSG